MAGTSAVQRVTLLVASAATFLLFLPPVAHGTNPGANGRIAFEFETPTASAPNASGVFTVEPDGSGVQRVTSRHGLSQHPSWSPDGSRIAFTSPPLLLGPGWAGIFTVNADGTDVRKIANMRFARTPVYSPDGRRVVYATTDGIYSIAADGARKRILYLAPPEQAIYDISLSPRGDRVAFALGHGRTPGVGIWSIRKNGNALKRLTTPGPKSVDLAPDWSPDGREIAFERTREGVFTMRSDGRRERPIPALSTSEEPAFSPAGDEIVAVRRYGPPGPDGCGELVAVSRLGSDARLITRNCAGPTGDAVHSPSWQSLPVPLP